MNNLQVAFIAAIIQRGLPSAGQTVRFRPLETDVRELKSTLDSLTKEFQNG
jgi:hypothetical protein